MQRQQQRKVDEVVMKMLKEAYAKAVTYIRENMDILDEAAEFLIQRETITGKEFMEIFNKYKNPVEESDKNVSETDENDAEISEAEVKTDSEIKTEEENTSTYNTGYASGWKMMTMKNNLSESVNKIK